MAVARRVVSRKRKNSAIFHYDDTKDAERPVTRVFRRVLLISRFFEGVITATARQYGLQRGDFLVLMTLVRVSGPKGMRPTELVRALLVTSGAITKQIDRLERLGLVERLANRADARSSPVRLTPEGRAIGQAVRKQRTLMNDVADRLAPGDLEDLDRLLKRYLAAVAETLDPGEAGLRSG
jgi:DNA-binding MarR family transcriptional regulator